MERTGVILIIDDDVDYSRLLEMALVEARIKNPIEVLNDGCAAVGYLKLMSTEGETPALVLLDLRMPKVGGLEVLRWIRNQPHFAQVPIAIFTGVEAGDEPSQALVLGASSLHAKPFSYRELVETVGALRDHYLGFNQLEAAAW